MHPRPVQRLRCDVPRRNPEACRVTLEMLETTQSRASPSRFQTRRYGGVRPANSSAVKGRASQRCPSRSRATRSATAAKVESTESRTATAATFRCGSIRSTSHLHHSMSVGRSSTDGGADGSAASETCRFAPRRYRRRQGAHRIGTAPQRPSPPARWPATPSRADPAPTTRRSFRPRRSPRPGGLGTRAPRPMSRPKRCR